MNWATFVLALVAALGAIVAVLTWWTQLRKTPEVEFCWRLSDQVTEWKVDEKLKIGEDEQLIHLALTNVGIGAARVLIVNIVVPAWINLTSSSDGVSSHMTSVEPAVGHHDPVATFVVIQRCAWPAFSPSFWPQEVRTPRCDVQL